MITIMMVIFKATSWHWASTMCAKVLCASTCVSPCCAFADNSMRNPSDARAGDAAADAADFGGCRSLGYAEKLSSWDSTRQLAQKIAQPQRALRQPHWHKPGNALRCLSSSCFANISGNLSDPVGKFGNCKITRGAGLKQGSQLLRPANGSPKYLPGHLFATFDARVWPSTNQKHLSQTCAWSLSKGGLSIISSQKWLQHIKK